MKEYIIYECEICGNVSTDKSFIELCEQRGRPMPLVKKGDLIYFKDCDKTPILYQLNNRLYSSINSNYEKEEWKNELDDNNPWNFGAIHKYEVAEINIDYHKISYVLKGIEEESIDFTYNGTFHYPTIEGNKMMELILKLYNQNKEEK